MGDEVTNTILMQKADSNTKKQDALRKERSQRPPDRVHLNDGEENEQHQLDTRSLVPTPAPMRRLVAIESGPSPDPAPVAVIILAILALVYFVIRRLRSRAPVTKTRSRVTAKRGSCPCRSPIEHQETEPLRYVVVLRTFAAKPKGGRNSPPSYTL